jgi:hypothetical protein
MGWHSGVYFMRLWSFTAAFALSVSVASAVAAQDRPYRLVCFEERALIKTLDGVVNAQQFLRNDSTLKNGSCDFAKVPSGSTARYLGVHQTQNGFLYPTYRVTYATTGQTMYSADGVFRSEHWRVRKLRGTGQQVIQPRRCDALDGFVSATGRVATYMHVPSICGVEIVE